MNCWNILYYKTRLYRKEINVVLKSNKFTVIAKNVCNWFLHLLIWNLVLDKKPVCFQPWNNEWKDKAFQIVYI